MATANDINRRLSLLEMEVMPEGKTHYMWADQDEATYRKERNIPDCDEVITIGWME